MKFIFERKKINRKVFEFERKLLPVHYLMGGVFANGPGVLCSFPDRVIPKTLKVILDTSLLNTQQYKDKVEQSREKANALPYTSV